MNTTLQRNIETLAAAMKQKREPKLFEVRFQEIKTHRVFVEANDQKEADFMAVRELQANPEAVSLIRTEFDFFTICQIEQSTH